MPNFKEIKIPKDRDWRKILPQLNKSSYYLIKTDGISLRWISSRIRQAGWIFSRNLKEEALKKILEKPHSWEYSVGTHTMPFEGSSGTYEMGKDIIEIWEIEDPEIIAHEAKNLLYKKEEEDEEEEDYKEDFDDYYDEYNNDFYEDTDEDDDKDFPY